MARVEIGDKAYEFCLLALTLVNNTWNAVEKTFNPAQNVHLVSAIA